MPSSDQLVYDRGVTLSTFCFSSIRKLGIAGAGLLCASWAHGEASSSHLAAPADLQTAGLSEPLAVTEAKAEFSWRDAEAAPSLHGVKQTGFQIRIASSSRGLATGMPLWDSGKVPGAATSVHADSYSGPGFESQHEYVWQVRVWDEKDQASAWSKPARWRQAPTWQARWIAADSTDPAAGSNPMPLLRKEFRVTGQVERALLHVSGLGQYELRINGSKAGNSELTPGWSDYRKTVFYDSYDVTAMVRSGSNAIGVMLGNGMYRVLDTPGRYKKFVGSFGPPQCIAQLHIELANGQSIDVVSDETWKTQAGPITFSSTYGSEDYDARREIDGWDRAGFDDSNWDRVVVLDGPGGALRPELSPPIRVMHTYMPIRRTEPKPGVVVYDLGQNFAGWPAITVSGPAGATVKLIPGELLNTDGTVSQRSSGEPQWFAYTLKGGAAEQWHPRFSYYGFRYVQVEGAAGGTHTGPGTPQLTALRGEAVHTSSEAIGSFTS